MQEHPHEQRAAGTTARSAIWKQHPFRVYIAVVFMALLFLVGAALVWSNYVQGRSMVLLAANDVLERIGREIRGEMQHLSEPVEAVVELLSKATVVDAESFEARMETLPRLTAVLDRHVQLESIYVGYFNGDFFQIHALRRDVDRQRFGAPPHAVYRMQSVERATHRTRFKLFDAALNEIEDSPVPAEYSYDPRERPWYIEAMRGTGGLIQTAPYVFFTTREIGQTFAQRAAHGRAVVGADVTLQRLSEALTLARPSPSSQLALFDAERNAIAYSVPSPAAATGDASGTMLPKMVQLSPVLAAVPDSQSRLGGDGITVEGRQWLMQLLPVTGIAKNPTYLAVATPRDELFIEARGALERNLWLALGLVAFTAPITWWIARRIAAKLNALTAQAAAIRRFKFDPPEPFDSPIIEISDLGLAMGQMRETIRKFVDVTTALSAERSFDRLLERVLQEAREAAGARGGVVYLLDEDGSTLKPVGQQWNSGQATDPGPLSESLVQKEQHPVARAARSAATIVETLAPQRPAGLEYLDRAFGDSPVTLVAIPLPDRRGTVIGVLCVFLADGGEPPSQDRLALVQAFAGAAAVAIDNQRLLAAHKALLDALISLIAGAIDAKSVYTGGHCQRVPLLTNMLARAVCGQMEGPFAGFDLDEEGWEALRIAGGLHDCGKVTTPEYVVDKATKLETLYDRIHEVRMRFEVLKRDAEISYLKAIVGGGAEAALKMGLADELRALDEEFAFVATCNEGGEFMAPEKVERLKKIAGRTWQRTLDDRLGVSWEEAKRKERAPATTLPATEQLLADKPEHVIERQPHDILREDNPWGFKLNMPKALYNRGELYNLCIARGTLTEEERYKINDHIVQTIIMLSALPLPAHLKAVPELAGGHHEKMDGTGYPKRLRRDDMSIPARIMAIADIFEALTAADRPYKKAKKLSEAVKIMSFMKKDKHIDPDLFDLFLSSGVYREYAEQFMQPEYVDEVDVAAYLSALAPTRPVAVQAT